MTKKIDRKLNGQDIIEKEFGDFKENGGRIEGWFTSVGNSNVINKTSGVEAQLISWDNGNISLRGMKNGQPTVEQIDLKPGGVYFGPVSKNLNGYTKLPNGMIMQWFQTVVTSNTTNDAFEAPGKINFPIAFPNAVPVCIATVYSVNGNAVPARSIYSTVSQDLSGCWIQLQNLTASFSQGMQIIVRVASIGW